MAKFLAIIDNNYDYIHEVFAPTKQAAFNQLSENVPKESISAIYSEKEFAALNGGNQIPMGGEVIEQPLDFNALITQTTQDALMKEQGKVSQSLAASQLEYNQAQVENKRETTKEVVPIQESKEVSIFTDNGMTYKIEGGVVYKRTWRDLSEDEISEFKIVSNTTNKDIPDNGKYKIQHLDWTPINK